MASSPKQPNGTTDKAIAKGQTPARDELRTTQIEISRITGSSKHEFLRLLEVPYELSTKLPSKLTHTVRIYQKLYGIATPALKDDLPVSHGENTLAKALHQCALSSEAWNIMNHPTRLRKTSTLLMQDVDKLRNNLEHWMDAFIRNEYHDLAANLVDHKHGAFLNGVAILQTINNLYQQAFAALRPCMANLETFNERKDGMVELRKIDPDVLIPCINSETYQMIEKEVEEVLVSHRNVPMKSRLEGRSILRKIDEVKHILFNVKSNSASNEADATFEDPEHKGWVFDGLDKCIQRARVFRTDGGEPGLYKVFAQAQSVHPGSMKARGAQRMPEARLNKRYSIESLFGVDEDRIVSFLRKRCMALLQNELLVDMYTLCTCLLTIGTAMAEALQQTEYLSEFIAHGHVIASHIIGATLPLMERTLDFEPKLVQFNIAHLTLRGLAHEQGPNGSMHRQVRKMRVVNQILEGLDVYVFPRSIPIHEAAVRIISHSSLDSNIVLTAGDDRAIRIWDLRTGECIGLFVGHKSVVSWCAFTPNDQSIVSTSFDMTIKIWDSRTGRCKNTLIGHTDAILDGDVSSNGKLVLSASMDSTVRIWSIDTGTCFRVFQGHRLGSWVKCVKFLPDNSNFVSAGLDGHIALWTLKNAPPVTQQRNNKNTRSNKRLPVAHMSPTHSFRGVTSTEPEGKGGEKDSSVQYDHRNEEHLHPLFVWTDVHHDSIISITMLDRPDGQSPLLYTASKDGSQQIIDLGTMELCKSIIASGDSTWALSIAISFDRRYFAIAHYDNTIQVHAVHNYAMLRRIHVQNHGITRIAFSSDSRHLLVGSSAGNLQILSL